MHPIDYRRSFSIGTAPSNEVRFWGESRTRLIDPDGQDEDFIQAASCKSEHTFAQSELFLADNYDFLPIFGRDHALIFRRKAFLNENYREYRNFADLWGGVRHSLVEAEVEPLLLSVGRLELLAAVQLAVVRRKLHALRELDLCERF